LSSIGGIGAVGLNDSTMSVLRAAIDGLGARQQAITSNVTNLETPNYLARTVNFEDSLRTAIADDKISEARVTVGRSLAATRQNGNNVNIDFELLAGSENVMAQKLMVQTLNSKYAILRTAISGA
jgi:flagellar basal-body rod protein FlgB